MRIVGDVVACVGGLAVLAALTTTSAEAADRPVPVTCGMVVQQDARLYLDKDLSCPDFGVRVEQEQAEPGPVPHVVVDLRGHTLRGPGTGDGLTAFGYPGAATVRAFNGRLENWDLGVGGDTDTRISNVRLSGNRTGFFCNGSCASDLSRFEDNSSAGLNVGAEAAAYVTHSTFSRNKLGATVTDISTLRIDRSIFLKNDTAVLANQARVTVSNSVFVKNDTAVVVTVADPSDDYVCADLARNTFTRNRTNVLGPIC